MVTREVSDRLGLSSVSVSSWWEVSDRSVICLCEFMVTREVSDRLGLSSVSVSSW